MAFWGSWQPWAALGPWGSVWDGLEGAEAGLAVSVMDDGQVPVRRHFDDRQVVDRGLDPLCNDDSLLMARATR